jgi:hypothetical protein
LTAATSDQGWLLHGGTQTGQRFSALNQINEQTVSGLGLVWSREIGTTRGLEATPIVDNGVIYTTGSWQAPHNLRLMPDRLTAIAETERCGRSPSVHSPFSVRHRLTSGNANHDLEKV